MEQLILLPQNEAGTRLSNIQASMTRLGIDATIISDNANLYYLSGRVFAGFAYIPVSGQPLWMIRRPVELSGEGVCYIHRPEDIPSNITKAGLTMPQTIGLEFDISSYSLVNRLSATFPESKTVNISPVLRATRAIKTPYEIDRLKQSGLKHEQTYRHIQSLYRIGMTDIELQIEIERLSRLDGCLGQFRISGPSMELFMGNLISGDNADTPCPYDFAMGGRGMSPSLPVGASGEELRNGTTVMIDINGNYTGYMTDMTRVFSIGNIPDNALAAHQCSIDIHKQFQQTAVPGTEAHSLYDMAMEIAERQGLGEYFMGHRQHAGFIGHGVGIEINELPVIAPRSRDILAENNVIALEPKFVIPGIGAVGIENTYLITPTGAQCLTNAPEEIVSLL